MFLPKLEHLACLVFQRRQWSCFGRGDAQSASVPRMSCEFRRPSDVPSVPSNRSGTLRSLQLDDTSKACRVKCTRCRHCMPLLISRLPRRSFQETSHDTKQALQVWLWKKNQAINRKMEILWRKDEIKIRKTLSCSEETCFSAFRNGKDEADDSCFLRGWRRIAGVATRPDLSGKWQMERAENLSGCCGCIEPAAICGACSMQRQ